MGERFIEISNLNKSFMSANGTHLQVLNNINLSIEKGEIFGIIGFSGAGKSTLVRCINRLEEPDSGSIRINGVEMINLDHGSLNARREKIGMIFQAFNLFDSKTIFGNIEFPLRHTVRDKKKRHCRVRELAELVNLSDKLEDYPSQLSGGQKQRVGIARALANEPDVLLSDEATSALDPQTTEMTLDLLKRINDDFGVTTIVITHEMEVIKYLCNRVAVIEDGAIVEQGRAVDVLGAPSSKTGRTFTRVERSFDDAWNKRLRARSGGNQ